MPASEPGAIRPDSWQRPLKFWEITPDKWLRFVAVHTRAPLALTNAVVPEMMRRGWAGSLIAAVYSKSPARSTLGGGRLSYTWKQATIVTQ